MDWKYDKKYKITRFEELFDLFKEDTDMNSEGRSFLFDQIQDSKKALSIILLNNTKREAKTSLGKYEEIEPKEMKDEWFTNYDYSEAIVFLVKWNHIIIDNELEDILTEDQYYVWNLRDFYGLSYADIGVIREHFEKSGNESTIRDIYMKARIKMKKLLDLCEKYSTYLKGV